SSTGWRPSACTGARPTRASRPPSGSTSSASATPPGSWRRPRGPASCCSASTSPLTPRRWRAAPSTSTPGPRAPTACWSRPPWPAATGPAPAAPSTGRWPPSPSWAWTPRPRPRACAAGSGPEREDVGHLALRGIEPHVGPVPVPQVGLARQLVVGLVGPLPRQPHRAEVEVEYGLLRVVGVDVDDDHDEVALVQLAAGPHEEAVVGRAVEADVAQPAQRRVAPADGVHAGDEGGHRVGPAPVARAELVLLRVEVLLVGVAGRLVLEQLVAAVHAVVGHEHGGQHEPHEEGRRRPVAQRPGEIGRAHV